MLRALVSQAYVDYRVTAAGMPLPPVNTNPWHKDKQILYLLEYIYRGRSSCSTHPTSGLSGRSNLLSQPHNSLSVIPSPQQSKRSFKQHKLNTFRIMGVIWVSNFTEGDITVQITNKTGGSAAVFTIGNGSAQSIGKNGWRRSGTEEATIQTGSKKKVLKVESNHHLNVYVDRIEVIEYKEFHGFD
ncbi:hypothetical protein HGRIS_005355 [Hohenbuehelia grisea]|uniref:Galectin n=1 Tax=Hohenbuehelia grisea TaxID=104357 RepID=A0ABR3JFN9_9AGAR